MGWLARAAAAEPRAGSRSAMIAGAAIFGALALWFGRAVLSPRAPMCLSPEGVEPWAAGVAFIPWTGVARVWAVFAKNGRLLGQEQVLCLSLHDPARVFADAGLLSRMQRRFFGWVYGCDVVLSAEAMVPGFDTLLGYAERAMAAVHVVSPRAT